MKIPLNPPLLKGIEGILKQQNALMNRCLNHTLTRLRGKFSLTYTTRARCSFSLTLSNIRVLSLNSAGSSDPVCTGEFERKNMYESDEPHALDCGG